MAAADGDKKFYIWDTYWNTNRMHSFGIELDSETSLTLERFWVGIAGRLRPGASVLDVACGNGAVGLALARAATAAGGSLAITGIDEAAVNPPHYVPLLAEILSGITFRPRTAMESLPFPNASFDAVVSQYGFEFGDPAKALQEASRVLKPDGFLAILALPAQCAAVQAARKSLKQARYLLHDSPLFKSVFDIIQAYHAGPAESREEKIRSDLESFNHEVEKAMNLFDVSEIGVVSAIITCLNKVFIDRKTASIGEQMMAIETTRTGLAHYAARGQATVKSAIADGKMEILRRAMTAGGFQLTETRSLFSQGGGIVAYQLNGQPMAVPVAPKVAVEAV